MAPRLGSHGSPRAEGWSETWSGLAVQTCISRPRTGVPLKPLRTARNHRRKLPQWVTNCSDPPSPSRPTTGAVYAALPVLSRPTTGAIYGNLPGVSRPTTGAVSGGIAAPVSRPRTSVDEVALPQTSKSAKSSRPATGADDVILPQPKKSVKLTAAHEVSLRLAEIEHSDEGARKDTKSRVKVLGGSSTPRTPRKDAVSESQEWGFETRPVPVVVEAPMSLTVRAGGETERVWPHTWLVLDSTTNIEAAASCLHADAGGGSIIEDEERSAPLHRVADERLNSTGAEANFQRSSRSASLIGLKHAAMILTLFGQRIRHPGSLVPVDPVPLPDPFASARVTERVRKVESIVAFRAATATQRAASRGEGFTGEAVTAKISRLPPLSQKPSLRQSANQKGLQALEDFNRFAEHKFGNSVRAWFMLAPEGKMTIGEKQFARGCDEIGFTGNVVALWRYLDSDQSGHITILELDNVAAIQLAEFKQVIRDRFEDSALQAFVHMDDNRSDRLFKDEFIRGIRPLGFKAAAAAKLFNMFDRERLGSITSKDLLFLDAWHPPPYLFSKPDMVGLENFKNALCGIYKSLLRAWRQVLDKDSTMRVSWDEFCAVCKLLEKSSGIPKTLEQMAQVWRALDEDCGGWIALRELDRESFECLAGFKVWALQNHGAACTAFQMLSGANAKLTESELPRVTDYNFNGKLFIQGLNLSNNVTVHKKPDEKDITKIHVWEVPFLVEKDIRFLDKWDLDWEEQETNAKHGYGDSNSSNAVTSSRSGG